MLETTIEEHGGCRLRVARVGAGRPCVLLHGYPDNLQIFGRLAPRLAERLQVIAPDWPGMGFSDEWPGGASPLHMANRLIALLDAWRIDACDVVGFDMGGQAAIVAAAKHPRRIRRLVISNSLVFGDAPTSWEIRVLRRFGWNRLVLSWLPRIVFARAERTFLPRGTRLSEDVHADIWAAFRRPDVRRYVVRMCAAYEGYLPRLPHLLPAVSCPTLVLWAERDAHFPLEHAERLHAAVAGARLEVVRGAEHWMAWDRAPDVARALLEHLAE